MTVSDAEAPPVRGARHEALDVFLGRWCAEGSSYGNPNQSPTNPKGMSDSWHSAHEGRWHTGSYFLVQDEKARLGKSQQPFDTLSIMGVDAKTGRIFARTFENHGFYRHYDVINDGRAWTFSGEHERARIVFSDDGRTQTIIWEWKPRGEWLPLCDRVATRID